MARTESLSILLDPAGKALLAEEYNKLIENLNKSMVSAYIKNKDLSGDPTAGSVEAKRLANASSKEYGTARAAGKGDKVKVKSVTVNIDQNRELVEEVEQKDLSLMGLPALLSLRANNHRMRMTSELDTAFFTEAKNSGTEFSTTETEIEEIIESAIQQVETTKNDYVDGVPREMMSLVCNPKVYGKIRNYLDKMTSNANINTSDEQFMTFHGVKVFSSVHLPVNTDFFVMVDGSIAQPVMPKSYTAEKIPMSEAYAVELFFYYGTKAVMPDLIIYMTAA